MKTFPSVLLNFIQTGRSQRNLLALFRFFAFMVVLVGIYSVLFHVIMEWEGQHHSWITGVYWALTVMSTLGFGDITFASDLGKIFSIVVLLSGLIFLLVLLPFTFIEFFYEPWVEAQASARVPRTVPEDLSGHVVLTLYGPIARALIEKLTTYHYPYVVILPELEEALRIHDEGVRVVVGELDDPEAYRRAGVERAALVATTRSDIVNTSVAFTVRELAPKVRIVATAREEASVEILKLAGCNRVLRLAELTGQALARRSPGPDAVAHVIGSLDELLIAEANAAQTPLVGETPQNIRQQDLGGATLVAVWERGRFEAAKPETEIGPQTVLVLAGSHPQLRRFDEMCRRNLDPAGPVLILGGGRVGRVTANALAQRGIDYRVVELDPQRVRDPDKYVIGNAADPDTLARAGIDKAPAVLITTHDDDTNIYLAIYCRRIRPDLQIISRATLERDVATLHRAGCDFVISYASMGANALFNLLKRSDILMVAEGLDVFKVTVPAALVGKTIADSSVRRTTGCSIIAIDAGETTTINPDPATPLEAGTELVLIGTVEAETLFLKTYAEN